MKTTEQPIPNSLIERMLYQSQVPFATIQRYRRLKEEGNVGSATSLASRVVYERYTELLALEHEYKMVIDEVKGPSIYDHIDQ